MSISTSLNFDSGANWSYDSDKIEFSGGKAQLKVETNQQDYEETFTSDAGFTYDSDKTEFSGGKIQQKDQRPAGATCGATYTSSINLNWGGGTLTGTASGGAAVSAGKLDLTSTSKYVSYSATGNADSTQTGCIRFKITPNYTGVPTGDKWIFSISKAHNNGINAISMRHSNASGIIRIHINNSAGALITEMLGSVWSPVAGTEYEFEFNWDLTTGANRLFINGVQSGATSTATGTRDSNIGLLRLGDIYFVAGAAVNCKIDDLEIFSSVQHTTNYTPGYTVQEYIYTEDTITMPEMEHTGGGYLRTFDEFNTTESGSPRYTVQIDQSGDYLYWNGSAWAVSDGSYAQANSETTFNSNVSSLDIDGATYGQFKIHFTEGNTQSYVDNLIATLTEDLQYYTDEPYLESLVPVISNDFISFTEESTKPAGTNIGWVIKDRDGNYLYWNGSAWAASNKSYAQSNTAADIETNLDSLISGDETYEKIYPVCILDSDGTDTPEIDYVEITHEYYTIEGAEIPECSIYFYVEDLLGDNYSDATFTVYSKKSFWHSDKLILPFRKSVSADSNGFINISVIETETIEQYLYFELSYTNPNTNSSQTLKFKKAIVPNQETVQADELLDI